MPFININDKQSSDFLNENYRNKDCIFFYYWNSCGHCHQFKPIFHDVIQDLRRNRQEFMKKALIFEIELDDIEISSYEDILSRFSNWKKYKREINLNHLLEEGKKVQFEVEIENNSSVFYVSTSDDSSNNFLYTTSLVNVCAVINKFTFIILSNKVIKLEVELKTLTTKWGKTIKNILESDIDLKLYQHKDIKGQIDNFYFQLPKSAA